jgi:broad specificity phosphatase PhoE
MNEPLTRVLLIRHAKIDTGPAPGRLCGCLDLPLSRAGRDQLRELTDSSRGAPDALFTSPLIRAREVAEALGSLWGTHPIVENGVSEIDCGRFEGMPVDALQKQYPEVWAANLAQRNEDFAWPGGESYRAFRSRVLRGVARIASAHPGARVAIVTHAGVVTQVLGALRGRSPAAWEPDRPEPLTATEVTWVNGAPAALLRFNERRWW